MSKKRAAPGADEGVLFRAATIAVRAPAAGEAETRLADLSFSSEIEVARWFGGEILDHSPNSVRMDFIGSGRAPLLLNHDRYSRPVGVVQSAEIGSDRKGRAVVRFGKSAEADSALQDVRDGILTNVSVGYRVHSMKLETSSDDGDVYRIDDWEPLEVSLVAIPADTSVGVGRSAETEALVTRAKELARNTQMTEATQAADAAAAEATRAAAAAAAAAAASAESGAARVTNGANEADVLRLERARVKEIRALAGRHNMGTLGEEHIDKGTSIELFRGHVLNELDARGSNAPLAANGLNLSEKDRKRYSLTNAIRVSLTSREQKAPIEKCFERDIHEELEKVMARDGAGGAPKGLLVPYDVFTKRDVIADRGAPSMFDRTLTSSGGVGTGGALVQSTVLAAQYVPPNYNVPIIVKAGARVLSGLIGNILIPAMTAGKSGTWITPENTAVSSADPTFAQIALNPHDLGTAVDISRRLLIQSNPAVDALLRDDIAMAIANTADQGGINGSGSSGQPTGLLNMASIGVQAGGTNGAALTWANVTYLPQLVGVANRMIDGAPLGFVTNWQAFAHALRTPKVSGYPTMIAEYADNQDPDQGPDTGRILGFPVHTSQNVPSTLVKGTSGAICSALIFGNFGDLLVGTWGPALDMLVDPYTFSNTGAIRIRAFTTLDINARYQAAFACVKDIITT